ncbi:hypothetical protein Dsin_000902 [Dipteronia sinensis]|uniref:Protein root UVB sensitive/RUS domain-containing protein n=1 Tax=Dipteronia sinensis TaxID=43782 RepID=A0AAE0B3C5_9ROSI|nr:hypothetical protein Dsin_000902 [Dipteronia sinensis]
MELPIPFDVLKLPNSLTTSLIVAILADLTFSSFSPSGHRGLQTVDSLSMHARATRLPIYSSFAKQGNLSDPFAKGEAISTLFNVLGIGQGILFYHARKEDAGTPGSVKVGRDLHKVVKPSKVQELKEIFVEEKFLLSREDKWTDLVL